MKILTFAYNTGESAILRTSTWKEEESLAKRGIHANRFSLGGFMDRLCYEKRPALQAVQCEDMAITGVWQ